MPPVVVVPPAYIKDEPPEVLISRYVCCHLHQHLYRIEINNNGTVREDKANSVKIFFNEKFSHLGKARDVCFKGLTLGDENFYERVRYNLEKSSEYEENRFFLFFSLKPNFGVFKPALAPETLATVQKASLIENTHLEVKMMVTKSLRPGHCLTEEFQVTHQPRILFLTSSRKRKIIS